MLTKLLVIDTKDNGKETFPMEKVMRPGLDLAQLPLIKANTLQEKSMVREDTSMEMNGSMKVNFQRMN